MDKSNSKEILEQQQELRYDQEVMSLIGKNNILLKCKMRLYCVTKSNIVQTFPHRLNIALSFFECKE